jgi:hypothetical protein
VAVSDKDNSILSMFNEDKLKKETKFKVIQSNELFKFNDVKTYKYCNCDNYDENCRLKVETYTF